MELSDADRIWNRAALESGGAHARVGDRALADLLFFHGMAMNGGLGHAYDVLSDDELASAIKGFRFFGFHELASFLKVTANLSEDSQEELSWKYAEFVPTDETLGRAFETFYHAHQEAFAPLSQSSHR